MKPFNLDEALAGKQVVDRHNNKVEQLKLYDTGNGFKLVYTIKAELYICTIDIALTTLFMATISTNYCASLFKQNNKYFFGYPYLAHEFPLEEDFITGFVKTIQFTVDE